MGNNKANLGLDILSGDDDLIDDDVKTYRANYYFMPAAAPSGMDDPYGSEIDIEAHIAWFPKSNIVLGAGFFFPGDNGFLLGAAGLPNAAASKETGILLYCMPVFNF